MEQEKNQEEKTKHTILTFTIYQKVLQKNIYANHFLTKSESEIAINKLHGSAVLHIIEHRESVLTETINISPIPTWQLIHEYDDKGYKD